MRALVTGASGFVGRHLVHHLSEGGAEVAALVPPGESRERLFPETVVKREALFECDLLDADRLVSAVRSAKPDAVYHLAAFSNPQGSLSQARLTLETNILGTENVLQAVRATGLKPRVLLVGSAQQYGDVSESEQPIREDRAQRPLTPYAVSKAAQELLGQSYFLSGELPVLSTRSFNHTGPGQSDAYVCSSFARQVAEVEKGKVEPCILVGNLAARRDFTDVRDVAAAYTAIVERGTPGRAYNVASGEAVSIDHILRTLVSLSDANIEVRVDPKRQHHIDAPLIVGDVSRLREECRWERSYSLEQTLGDLLNDWRHRAPPG